MSNFEGRRHVARGDGGFPKRTQCQTLRASCSFYERRAHGSRRRFLWSAWSLLPLSGMACPPRALVPKQCKPTHSNSEQAERKPFWGFAPNEPIFRFRSIRGVAASASDAASDAVTDSGVSSVEILKRDAFQLGELLRRAARIHWRTPTGPYSPRVCRDVISEAQGRVRPVAPENGKPVCRGSYFEPIPSEA